MSNSAILGKCDMVLAISEDTVNYQFQELQKRGIIHGDWNIMVFEDGSGNVSKVLMNQSAADFKDQLDKQEFVYAFQASLGAPTISVLQNERKVLTFLLSFSNGTMYYWLGHGPSSHLKQSDMAGWLYGFKVQIGSIQKDAKDVKWITPESESSFNQNCADSGLNQNLFSIESIFMDFENANYAEYDATKSKVPTDIQELAIFQNLLSNYFTTLAKTDNPYILGYGMKLKTIAENAMFSPTSLRYSTSYDDDSSLRSFNFLMMIDGNSFPAGQDVGVLPNSLITTKMPDESGVLAIDFNTFEIKFLKPFIDVIQDAITNGFDTKTYSQNGQDWSLSSSHTETKETDEPPSDFLKKTDVDSVVNLNSTIQLRANDTASLKMQTLIDYDLDIKVRPWELLHAGRVTEAEFWLSTSGQKDVGPDKVHKGQQGKIDINIALGNEGKMQVSDSITNAYMGVSKDPYYGSKGGVGVWAIIQSDWNNDSAMNAAQVSLKAFNGISASFTKVKDNLDAAIKGINSGKVILPLGKIYAYKDIQLNSNKSQADNPVQFKVSYAPEN